MNELAGLDTNPNLKPIENDRFLVDVEALRGEIRKLAAEDPDRVYEPQQNLGCYYARDRHGIGREHGCIVGQAIFRLIPEMEPTEDGATFTLPGYPSYDQVEYNGIAWNSKKDYMTYPVEFPEDEWIEWVQFYQDRGNSWSEAVETADQRHGYS